MRKVLSVAVVSFILGVVFSGIFIYQISPGLMLKENQSKFDSFEETVHEFEQATEIYNWKIVATHDLQQSMMKYGIDVKSVKVFDLCKPEHAGRILKSDEERIVSSLMPCRVAIYEKTDGKVFFSRLNSGLMAMPMEGIIPEVMAAAAFENEKILEAIAK